MGRAVLGILMLLNLFVWPRWTGIDGWLAFFAVIIILCGIWTSIMPSCTCNAADKPAPKKKR